MRLVGIIKKKGRKVTICSAAGVGGGKVKEKHIPLVVLRSVVYLLLWKYKSLGRLSTCSFRLSPKDKGRLASFLYRVGVEK